MVSVSAEGTHPAFRLAEKHFKNRTTNALPALRGLPEFTQPVLDLSGPSDQSTDPVWQAGWWGEEYTAPSSNPRRRKKGKERVIGERGERPCMDLDGVPVLELKDGRRGYLVAEGCVLIPNYLNESQQLELLESALFDYTRPPNPLSLDTHFNLPPDLFELYATEPDTEVAPRHLELDSLAKAKLEAETARTRRELIETAPAAQIGYDEVKRRNATWTGDVPSLKVGHKTVRQLVRELRWANLGWVYQWSTKSYDFSTDTPIPFPAPLAELCREAVRITPWPEVFPDESFHHSWDEDYDPDTGIVNFYQMNDTLMAHVDRSELDPSRPLVSISLGHAAIFLLGSASRSDPPRPLILRSGDVFIMAGKGRQAYHGVPRIMEDTLPAHFLPAEGDSVQMRTAKEWIGTARVNINARQVFPPGFQRPE